MSLKLRSLSRALRTCVGTHSECAASDATICTWTCRYGTRDDCIPFCLCTQYLPGPACGGSETEGIRGAEGSPVQKPAQPALRSPSRQVWHCLQSSPTHAVMPPQTMPRYVFPMRLNICRLTQHLDSKLVDKGLPAGIPALGRGSLNAVCMKAHMPPMHRVGHQRRCGADWLSERLQLPGMHELRAPWHGPHDAAALRKYARQRPHRRSPQPTVQTIPCTLSH